MEAFELADPTEFLRRLAPWIEEGEARNNLILGIAGNVVRLPKFYAEYHCYVVDEEGELVAAALQTPPRNLILGDSPSRKAVSMLAGVVDGVEPAPPGVVGNRPAVDYFNEAWAVLTGTDPVLEMAHGVFQLDSVEPVPAVPGGARPAVEGERDLLVDWVGRFTVDVGGEAEHLDIEGIGRMVDMQLRPETDGGLWLWEYEREAVSLCGFGGPTPRGMRIGPVYTPPEHRRHGYATSLVAATSAWLLSQGRRFCFLYTDLANPTSNAIYERIGYRRVAESAEYRFPTP